MPRKIISIYRKELCKNPTKSEWGLRRYLQRKGIKFKFQKILGNFIYDFFFKNRRLIIELDGGYHSSDRQTIKDLEKEKYANECGFKLLRFENDMVYDGNIRKILNAILSYKTIKKEKQCEKRRKQHTTPRTKSIPKKREREKRTKEQEKILNYLKRSQRKPRRK